MIEIVNNIFSYNSDTFNNRALEIFRFQYSNNSVYKNWVNALSVKPETVSNINEIPYLPVSFFKSHRVVTGDFTTEAIFTSSGTTQTVNSSHYVKDAAIYEKSFVKGFNHFYGEIKDWCILGLLPSYLERKGSSLVTMVDKLIQLSLHPGSGFYLYNFDELARLITRLEKAGQKILLLGVTFALLDFAEQFPMQLKHTVVMETGGMKGRKREMIREEVHTFLKEKFDIVQVHSEYGMTELLSQAYSKHDGLYKSVPWMRVLVREEDDPMNVSETGKGLINIIDLANIYSCSFIATDDVGIIHKNGLFEVIGRMDTSDIRGCSLLVV